MYKVKNGTLNIEKLNLTSLDELPLDVERLFCSRNNLKQLPELPKNLKDLFCFLNNLTSLPELPDSLIELQCEANKLTSLPELPKKIMFINCTKNKLTSLPELPDSLESLYCSDNPLECLIPKRFLIFQHSRWKIEYYNPYITSYDGQKNILTKYPNQCTELIKQANIHKDIRKEFSHLFNAYELNLL